MRLDVDLVRYLTKDEYRVLVGIEMGMRNHEIVPKELVCQISKVRSGEAYKLISDLCNNRLVTRVRELKHEGYKLTVSGYDYLAFYTLSKQELVYGVGNKIGVGKESDVYLVSDQEGTELVLKLHRLGRTSFRKVKEKRDYLGNRTASSWLYLSRLSALRELTFMKLLHEHGFPVPKPIGHNRHAVLMSFVNGIPLQNVNEISDPEKLYEKIMDLMVRLASAGLIHGDYNEFNIMIDENCDPVLIDFPQIVSIDHSNAEMYFDRDVQCIKTFFLKKFKFQSDVSGPELSEIERNNLFLDIKSHASGSKRLSRKKLMALAEDYPREDAPDTSDSLVSSSESDYNHSEEDIENGGMKRMETALSKISLDDIDKFKLTQDTSTVLRKNFKKHISKQYTKPKKTKSKVTKDACHRSASDQVKNFAHDLWG